jgi:hypothetical protein
VLRGTVDSLVVQFPQEVDFLWTGLPIQLERIGPDGTATPLFDVNSPPTPSFDETGSVATFTLDQPLGPGHYRVVLTGVNDISEFLSNGLWDSTLDQSLADFTVLPDGPTLEQATDLSTIGANVQTVAGSLNLSPGQTGVALYKFTLGTGHFWRLAAELDASRIGSGLLGALTLFDSTGTPLITRDAGTGRPDFPRDPYLFKGLPPGVYYLGVSGAGNLPGTPGGYDPKTGDPGSAAFSQAGGNFQLKLAADPADAATTMTGFQLTWADMLDPSPTGLTLAFSGPIDLDSVAGGAAPTSPVVAVDQSGKVWTLTPSGYDESKCQLSLVFDQALPAGSYTLQSVPGGLIDLAGLAVVGPGKSSGQLATWNVSGRSKPAAVGDLGVVWPSLTAGASLNTTLSPGQVRAIRVVIPLEGWYKLQTGGAQQILDTTRLGPDGLVYLGGDQSRLQAGVSMYLKPGVYLFTVMNPGAGPAALEWRLRPMSLDPESLVGSGVGQSAALSLRLLNPLAPDFTSGAAPDQATVSAVNNGSTPPVANDVSTPSAPGPAASGPGVEPAGHLLSNTAAPATGASPLPSSLPVAVSSTLLGRPGSDTLAGSAGEAAAPGQAAPLTTDPTLRSYGMGLAAAKDPAALVPDPPPPALLPPVEALATTGQPGPGMVVAPQAATGADALALIRAERIVDLASRVGRFLMRHDAGAQEPESAPDELLASLLAGQGTQPGRPEERLADAGQDRIERADLGVPLSFVVAAAAAYRLRQFAAGWWRRSRARGSRGWPSRGWAGPHLGRIHPRADNRADSVAR